jgi:cardiolipin synthase
MRGLFRRPEPERGCASITGPDTCGVRHIPNIICLLRIALIWPIVRALLHSDYVSALVLFGVAAVSDGLDGFLAKRFQWTSAVGKFLDPLADKLLLVSVFVVASWSTLVPLWLAIVVIARDFVIGLGALVFRVWFGPLRGRPTVVSKVNTALQIAVLLAAILHAAYALPPREVVAVLAVITLVTTIASGIDYLTQFMRRAWSVTAERS